MASHLSAACPDPQKLQFPLFSGFAHFSSYTFI
ncbi:hypothetical protein CGMCC3_g13716 [Colletotrichum fructicola]|nr:uncharacterized protein CGMCC3_g13716 [Colletotrichum fructicola]KAE9570115.1 hypothetical protein CGMCC3_g13716 [Colletotrichum fructicola]